mmetsp:Transcript_2869/g.3374  ORF Transcript_2869/g.3374 Transcript_2869/m.3374 type:complete len:216 (-) Transcript_2869:361-1008(-)
MISPDIDSTPSVDSVSSSDTNTTASTMLRERRAKQAEQEMLLRNRMNRISSPSSLSLTSSASLDGSFESSSLISYSFSRSQGSSSKDLKWEKMTVEFCFGLLTSEKDAPFEGLYKKRSSRIRSGDSIKSHSNQNSQFLDYSPILSSIMQKAGEISKAAVQHRSGNVIIKARSPYVASVVQDSKFSFAFLVFSEIFPCFNLKILIVNIIEIRNISI